MVDCLCYVCISDPMGSTPDHLPPYYKKISANIKLISKFISTLIQYQWELDKFEFAIVVISDSFFGRDWTERELSEFLQRQNKMKQKIVLPLLHNITFEQLNVEYPSLQYIQGIRSDKYSLEQISILFAKELIKRYKE